MQNRHCRQYFSLQMVNYHPYFTKNEIFVHYFPILNLCSNKKTAPRFLKIDVCAVSADFAGSSIAGHLTPMSDCSELIRVGHEKVKIPANVFQFRPLFHDHRLGVQIVNLRMFCRQ